ncbi:MAG: GTP-binding protein [Candidatus Heimdallarchaeota archaeon]|nr:GTP-binding protein [Candidatus Heimdallarchaeota archaeon]MCK4768871.1 GTP-binding protein [Candidatus Heimdallarchaeota archaeon]
MEDILNLNKKGIPITVVGLPYAGKTTLVNWLSDKRFTRPKPTVGLKFNQIEIGDVIFNIFDLSGQAQYREKLWETYVMTSAGIIFILDSSDPALLEEAKKWFWTIINEWLHGIFSDKVILFLANKSDLQKSMKLDEIIENLELTKMSSIPNISFQIFKTSIRTSSNVDFAMKWFFSKIKQSVKKQKMKPSAIIVSDTAGTPIYLHDPNEIVDDTGMFVGYLRALSGFSNELLGQEKFKVIKVDDHYFFISEGKNHIVTIAAAKESALPEARRLSFLIQEFLLKDESLMESGDLDSFISEYLI